ncbi:MAG: 3-dehydroquinate synthase [Gammaproteobacteria bacterium]|nr:3-dehydroquinate synthase [Gammaproteobacteria bacterium]
MIRIDVELGARGYPIFIGQGLLADHSLLGRAVKTQQVMLVTNERVGPLYAGAIETAFQDRQLCRVTLPDGEAYKTLDSLSLIMTALLQNRFERGCTVVALGGGVVGDVAGFAAACYQRGVSFVQLPTTLLAQVDSAVGGKTAVNHPLGKNMIGAFHQPVAVVADLATLTTLDEREFRAGLAEVIKYGLLRDREFFDWLESNLDSLLAREVGALTHAVRRSCENKASVVGADEQESGERALLNLGHTFGHAIENVLGYGVWLHGEAVAAGLCMAAQISTLLGNIAPTTHDRIVQLVERAGLPTAAPEAASASALLAAMSVDKKNRGGRIRLVLLDAIGHASLREDYPHAALLEVLQPGAPPSGVATASGPPPA